MHNKADNSTVLWNFLDTATTSVFGYTGTFLVQLREPYVLLKVLSGKLQVMVDDRL